MLGTNMMKADIAPTLFQLRDEGRPVRLDAINRTVQSFRVKYTDIQRHVAVNEICQLASSYAFSGVSKSIPIKKLHIVFCKYKTLYYLCAGFIGK